MCLVLTTDRPCLRPLEISDLDVSTEMLTDPEVVKYVCDLMTLVEIQIEMEN